MKPEEIAGFEPQTLRRLLKERDFFQAVFDAMPLQIVIKDAREESFGRFLLWNKTAEKLLGISAQQALGREDRDFFPAEQSEFFLAKDREALEGRVSLDIPEEVINTAENGTRILHTIKTPIYDEEGRPLALLNISEDITEKKTIEAERLYSLELLEKITSQIPGAVYQYHVSADDTHSFVYVSERIRDVYGRPPEELTNDVTRGYDLIHPEDVERIRRSAYAAEADSSEWRHEFRVFRENNEMRWVLDQSVPQRMADGGTLWFGFLMDITEQKMAVDALSDSEERWNLALAASDAGVWDWNIKTGQVFFSEHWRKMLGYTMDELPPTPQQLLQFVHPEDRKRLRSAILSHLRRRSEVLQCEYRIRHKDGNHIWVLARGKCHVDGDSLPVRMICTLIDITERKQIEASLLQAKNAAEEANRTKSAFLAMMSHEIRTPLNGVLGFADLLASTALTKGQLEHVHTIKDSGTTLLTILDDILDYSKIESGRLELDIQPTDPRQMIESAAEVFSVLAAAQGIALNVKIDDSVPRMILCDPVRVRQILLNLISNAVKFTECGSVDVTIAAEQIEAAEDFRLKIRVADTGIGISAEAMSQLFEPFLQADSSTTRKYGGTGLGLAIVKRLADIMGAWIEVESLPGAGTTFEIDLPVKRSKQPLNAEVPHVQKTAFALLSETHPLRILIVEDNAINRRLVRLVLEKWGYQPDEVDNGADAVDKVLEASYDLVLMDVQMPDMDGLEATQSIRGLAGKAQPKIVAITAHATERDERRCLEHGMDGFVTKPLKPELLRIEIERLFGQPEIRQSEPEQPPGHQPPQTHHERT